MRNSKLITISVPPAMEAKLNQVSRKKNMTRSELFRAAFRHYLDETYLDEILREAEEEFRSGKAKILPRGGLVSLMKKK